MPSWGPALMCLHSRARFRSRSPQVLNQNSMLRLREKGLPGFGGGASGDLYVRIKIHVPERLTDRQRRLFEQLRALATPKVK